MNIFDNHLTEIQNLILANKSKLKLDNIANLKDINLEIPPQQFNFDLSCNIALVLGKSNKLDPKDLAKNIKDIFLEKIVNFSKVEQIDAHVGIQKQNG